jgi:hypothetical protein
MVNLAPVFVMTADPGNDFGLVFKYIHVEHWSLREERKKKTFRAKQLQDDETESLQYSDKYKYLRSSLCARY